MGHKRPDKTDIRYYDTEYSRDEPRFDHRLFDLDMQRYCDELESDIEMYLGRLRMSSLAMSMRSMLSGGTRHDIEVLEELYRKGWEDSCLAENHDMDAYRERLAGEAWSALLSSNWWSEAKEAS